MSAGFHSKPGRFNIFSFKLRNSLWSIFTLLRPLEISSARNVTPALIRTRSRRIPVLAATPTWYGAHAAHRHPRPAGDVQHRLGESHGSYVRHSTVTCHGCTYERIPRPGRCTVHGPSGLRTGRRARTQSHCIDPSGRSLPAARPGRQRAVTGARTGPPRAVRRRGRTGAY